MMACTGAMAADGNDLLKWCKNASSDIPEIQSSFTAGFCLGTMQTVGELTPFINDSLGSAFKICPPSEITNGQGARIVVKYIQQNPEKLHFNATALAIMALQNAYPCKG
jgi:hypothetical protein